MVLHMAAHTPSLLPQILRDGIPIREPRDGDPIEPGVVYVAGPGRHLLVDPGRARVIFGPKENGYRPSVDALFRSAARAYGSRVIAVVLSGSLDDGAAGARRQRGARARKRRRLLREA